MTSLELTAENLRQSIAARKAVLNPSEDHKMVTEQEGARLREVESAIAQETAAKPEPAYK